jgi:hypothetical protein
VATPSASGTSSASGASSAATSVPTGPHPPTVGHLATATRDSSTALHGFARGSGGLAMSLGVSAGDTRESELRVPPPPAPARQKDTLDAPEPPQRPLPSKRRVPLLIVSTPPGSVRIDDRVRGRSPLTTVVESGPHEVVVERPRYLPGHAHIEGPGRVVLELQRPPATLHVTSTPSGAIVRVDGQQVGTTPVNLTVSGYEQHKVEIELNGHVERRKVYLKPPLGSVDVEFTGNASRSGQLGTRSERSPLLSARPASP